MGLARYGGRLEALYGVDGVLDCYSGNVVDCCRGGRILRWHGGTSVVGWDGDRCVVDC